MSDTLTATIEKLYHLLHHAPSTDALGEFLTSMQPADVAELVERLNEEERTLVLQSVDPEFAARILIELEYDQQRELILALPESVSIPIVEEMSADDLADLLGEMRPQEAETVLDLIPEEAEEIRTLLQYPEDTAGGLMNPDFIAVTTEATVEETLNYLRRIKPDSETAYYIYVNDPDGTLAGVVSLRQLVVSEPDTRIGDIVKGDVITIPLDMHQEEVALRLERYSFLALPVVDESNRLLGIVTVDDVIDVIREETSEDIARMGGVEPLEQTYLSARVTNIVRKRVGWLLVLFGAQSLTGNIIAFFEGTLAAVTLLAVFIPLLIGSGGNAGAQAATTVVRAMAMGEVSHKDVFRVISREMMVGIILGTILAVVGFGWSQIFGGGMSIAYTVAVSLFCVVLLASTAGSTLPILAKRLGFDPAVASAPLITTFVDAAGLFIYFLVARWILGV